MADIASINSGMLGIQRGMHGLRKAAAEIASAEQLSGGNPADMARPLVDMIGQRNQVQASAEVVKTASDLIGTLFDDQA